MDQDYRPREIEQRWQAFWLAQQTFAALDPGQEGFDPGWSFGPEGERFEVEVTGDPSSKVTFHGWHPASIEAGLARNPGVVATAVHGVSAIPYVCRAEPGMRTYLDLPLVAGRAAPELGRSRA